MTSSNPIEEHRNSTEKLARSLEKNEIYKWLVRHGYFPESYVLPPCFRVMQAPKRRKHFFKTSRSGKKFKVPRTECVDVHFPKTELTDITFGIMHPEIHNDIAYHIANNWKTTLNTLFHKKNTVASYSFPLPIDSRNHGKLGSLRSGRMIYEFIGMIDKDLATVAYRYDFIVKTDIKNFYRSIYTHSIAWALHGKSRIRKPKNMHNFKLLGNRLDKLFQNCNDGCTNGIPIGPVVSDLVAEIVAAGADRLYSESLNSSSIDCATVRFKDDYRILVKSEEDARKVIKHLQSALRIYNLELSDEKTSVSPLPEGLFRDWVSMYHLVHPRRKTKYTWKEFRELYLAVIRIDKECSRCGVIDRFLADIIDKSGKLKVTVGVANLERILSMLLMLANLRVKAFPKIVAIIESIVKSSFGRHHEGIIVEYLDGYLGRLSQDEERNKYLIAWISYFIVSNGLKDKLETKPSLKDLVTRSVFNNRPLIFKECKDFKLFLGCRSAAKEVSMLEHLDVFNPPSPGETD